MKFRVPLRALPGTLLLGLILVFPGAARSATKDASRSAPAQGASKDAGSAGGTRPYGRALPDPTGAGFLPDSFVIARVQERVVRVGDYVDSYFNSYVEYRPEQDSLGRVEFLKSTIHKDLLAIEALRINRPLSFEDRAVLREFANRVYSNVLYQQVAIDPVKVTDEEVRTAYEYFKSVYHLRHIVFAGREAGERVRRDLIAGRIGWPSAVRRYSAPESRANDGDLGWKGAMDLGLELAAVAHPLQPGQMSPLVRVREGWNLVQCVERRPTNPPRLEGLANIIRTQLRSIQSNRLAEALQDTLAAEIGLAIDSTNVRWAAARFEASTTMSMEGPTPEISISGALPELGAEDTSRVLARYRGGQLSLGQFLEHYSAQPPIMRSNVNDFWSLRDQAIAMALDPYTTELAIRRGANRDPSAVRMVEQRREQLLVEHLYEDSVTSKVWVRNEERHAYYEKNRHRFFTYPKVTFAAIARSSRAGIDSVAARIRAGESAVAILRADSLAGLVSGSVQERSAGEKGTPYYKMLFEDLRPDRFDIGGPDRKGGYALIYLLTRDDGRQLSYEESEQMVDESLQNIRSEERLNALLDRLSRTYRVDWRPDLVMRVRLEPKPDS